MTEVKKQKLASTLSYRLLESIQNEDAERFDNLLEKNKGCCKITEEMAVTAIEQSLGEMLEMMAPHTTADFWTAPGIWVAVLATEDEGFIDLIYGFSKGAHPSTIEGVPFHEYVMDLDLSEEIVELLS